MPDQERATSTRLLETTSVTELYSIQTGVTHPKQEPKEIALTQVVFIPCVVVMFFFSFLPVQDSQNP